MFENFLLKIQKYKIQNVKWSKQTQKNEVDMWANNHFSFLLVQNGGQPLDLLEGKNGGQPFSAESLPNIWRETFSNKQEKKYYTRPHVHGRINGVCADLFFLYTYDIPTVKQFIRNTRHPIWNARNLAAIRHARMSMLTSTPSWKGVVQQSQRSYDG